jgi:adenylyltransferase/sulfurtransferase
MQDNQLLRFSRQIMLPSIGLSGQEKLLKSKVLIIGLGGLGSPAAMYLAASGIGELTLVDFDKVDLSNLQRQIAHTMEDIGRSKVQSAKDALLALNPECRIDTVEHKLELEELHRLVANSDLVIDCSDNFATRFNINKASVAKRTPLVSGAAIRMEGQVTVFSGQPEDPCYRCLYGPGDEEATCVENGILAPVAGIIGSIQATEAIKVLTNTGSTLNGKLLLLDAIKMEWRTLKLKADPECPVCGSKPNQ